MVVADMVCGRYRCNSLFPSQWDCCKISIPMVVTQTLLLFWCVSCRVCGVSVIPSLCKPPLANLHLPWFFQQSQSSEGMIFGTDIDNILITIKSIGNRVPAVHILILKASSWEHMSYVTGLHIILEWLHIVGFTWVCSRGIGAARPYCTGEDRTPASQHCQSESDLHFGNTDGRFVVGRSFETYQRHKTTGNYANMDRLSEW